MSQPSHTTGKGHKAIPLLIITLIILLVTGGVIWGVVWGRQGLRIGGITVIQPPSGKKFSPRENYSGSRLLKGMAGIGTAVKHTEFRSGRSATLPEIYGPYRGVVDHVHDGDTVDVRLDLGFDLTVYARVRVKGINAPELSTEAGKRARDFAQSVLPAGTAVRVTSYGWDKYGGRIDGAITLTPPYELGNEVYDNFASLMLDTGHALPYNP